MIYETAGVLGLDPGPFSLRELVWMIEGLRIETWQHTASILAMHANINRQKGGKTYGLHDFHPYMEKPKPKSAGIDILKVFVNGR